MLKKYDLQKGDLTPVNIKVQSKYKDTISNNVITKQQSLNTFEELINSRLSKSGDIMNGFLEFETNSGISGTYLNENSNATFNSKIVYLPDSFEGYNHFKVINSRTIVQNDGTITENLESQFNLLADDEPYPDSSNLITSGTLYTILQDIKNRLTALENS